MLERVVEKIVRYPQHTRRAIAAARLDGYYDGLFRSLKCFRHGFAFGRHQMAAREMEYLIETLWAMNGFVPPFVNRAPYLLHTLGALPMPAETLRDMMERIARDADIAAQIALFDRMAAFAREMGYESVLFDWEGELTHEVDLHRSGDNT